MLKVVGHEVYDIEHSAAYSLVGLKVTVCNPKISTPQQLCCIALVHFNVGEDLARELGYGTVVLEQQINTCTYTRICNLILRGRDTGEKPHTHIYIYVCIGGIKVPEDCDLECHAPPSSPLLGRKSSNFGHKVFPESTEF